MAEKGKSIRPPVEEKMRTISFQMKPSDIERAAAVFSALGLSQAAGIRLAVIEWINSRDPNKGK